MLCKMLEIDNVAMIFVITEKDNYRGKSNPMWILIYHVKKGGMKRKESTYDPIHPQFGHSGMHGLTQQWRDAFTDGIGHTEGQQ